MERRSKVSGKPVNRQRNTRELNEALERQTATSEVLHVIGSSAFDLQTAFSTVLKTAMRLCESNMAAIWRSDGETFKLAASLGLSRHFEKFAKENPISPGPNSLGRENRSRIRCFGGSGIHA